MLSIFSVVNRSLWRIKARQRVPHDAYEFPRALPLMVRELLAVGG